MGDKDQEKGPELVSEAERDFALNALTEYKKKNYSACLQNISKLEQTRPKDFKVLQNKAVVEYFKSDLRKTEQFKNSLNAICNQFKIKVDKLEEIDYCIAQFNQAIILFHQKEYTSAQAVMDRVYKFIEPMEEGLSKQVSLLAIELQLVFRRPHKALTLISYLENNLMYGGSAPLKGLEKAGKEKKLPLPAPKPISEDLQKKLLKYKVRCYLLNRSLTLAAKEIPVLLKDKCKIEAVLMAANLEYLKGNLQESLKLLSSIPEDALSYNEYGESSKVLHYNNLGILHHALGKPNLATHYFQTAFKEDMKLWENIKKKDPNDLHLYTRGGCKNHELMYNLGIALLYTGRAAEAFDCLIFAVRRYHRNSRLWLRIAECCIAVHKKSNEIDFDVPKKQKELIEEVVGSGIHRKVVLAANLSKDKKYNFESISSAIPVPTLEFSVFCLRNAKLLLPADLTEAPLEPLFLVPGVTPPAPPPSPTLAPSTPASGPEIQALKNTILAASAYVCLSMGDYITSLNFAKELLAQEKISGAHKLLGHLYAAECLVLSDQIPEAVNYLDPQNIKDIDLHFASEFTPGEDSVTKTNPPLSWFPNNLPTAHAIMQYNIAVAKTIRGQFEQAGQLLKQIWQQRSATCQVPAHIIMLVIYIELQLGHAEIARNLLRQYSLQHRMAG
ncbi:CCR4-NOT transcription complex subunit 10 [Euwallacea fornicatus]|uniref:CCR4-NOT transcription complex subunit 10 n=1 Tax=Euwallacea fornicatus TaxID=995702 RepID=UPI00338D74C2